MLHNADEDTIVLSSKAVLYVNNWNQLKLHLERSARRFYAKKILTLALSRGLLNTS